MATYLRHKVALKAATLAYLAGGHSVTEEVDKMQDLVYSSSETTTDARREMLLENYERFIASEQGVDLLSDILDEEALYPFENEWPRDALSDLLEKTKPLLLSFSGGTATEFRFKGGYKDLLDQYASGIESNMKNRSRMDHWLLLLLNNAFFAGATIAAQMAENSKPYYAAIDELESEGEAWGRYPQLASLYDKQLRRETKRKTGLVDLDF